MHPRIALGWMAGAIALACTAWGGVEILPTQGRNVYRLVAAELDGRPGAEIVGSTYDERVCAFRADGSLLWEAKGGGFVFDLAAGDLDGDGRDDVVAACADGSVRVWGADGKPRWTHATGAPVYQAAVARLDGKTPVVLASGVTRELIALAPDGKPLASAKLNGAGRMMRAGDFDGDGADEVAVMPIRGQAQDVCFFEGPKLSKLKATISSGMIPWDPVLRRSKDTGEDFRKGKRTWTGQSLKKANGTAADLDGDGADELVFTPGVHALKGGLREVFALPDAFKTPVTTVSTTCACSPPAIWSTRRAPRLPCSRLRSFDCTARPASSWAEPPPPSDSRTSSTCPARRTAASCSGRARTATTTSTA